MTSAPEDTSSGIPWLEVCTHHSSCLKIHLYHFGGVTVEGSYLSKQRAGNTDLLQ